MNKIMVCGDIHGDAAVFQYRIHNYFPTSDETDSIICVGDVGLSYDLFEGYALYHAMFKNFKGNIYILRGNHDDRYWMNNIFIKESNGSCIETPKKGWYFEQALEPSYIYDSEYPNIKYLRDEGGIFKLNQYNILYIPGAYSIDKWYRLRRGLSYNPREQLSKEEMSKLYNDLVVWLECGNRIDYVISHTAPLQLEHAYEDLFIDGFPQDEVDKSTEIFLDKIYNLLDNNYIHWYLGHFHDDRDLTDKVTMLYSQMVELGDKIG